MISHEQDPGFIARQRAQMVRRQVEEAVAYSRPFVQIIQQVRLLSKETRVYDPKNGSFVVENADRTLDELHFGVIEECESILENIHANLYKSLWLTADEACVDGHSSHTSKPPANENMGEMQKTSRGFDVLAFRDGNGAECKLQQSTATDGTERGRMLPGSSYIWLGNVTQERLHFSREQVHFLVYHLNCWLRTGSLTELTEQK